MALKEMEILRKQLSFKQKVIGRNEKGETIYACPFPKNARPDESSRSGRTRIQKDLPCGWGKGPWCKTCIHGPNGGEHKFDFSQFNRHMDHMKSTGAAPWFWKNDAMLKTNIMKLRTGD